MKETQTIRVLKYIATHPGASSLEITLATGAVNVTGRVSDIRALPGHDVLCRKRSDGRLGYWLQLQPAQMAAGL